MEYILHLTIMILLYTQLAQTLDLAAGHTGLISLAHAGFYGIGAYTSALLTMKLGTPIFLTIPIAAILCGLVAAIVSLVALKTVEDYFIICTLGVQIIIYLLLNNWVSLTRGPLGISGIPALPFPGPSSLHRLEFLILTLGIVAFIWRILRNLSRSAFGLVLNAISQDEIYTASLGRHVYAYKVIAFTLSAALASIPGCLYARYISYIDPTGFSVNESIFILSIVIIGGMGRMWGSFLSATFLILLPELLRFVGIPEEFAANTRQITYGLILVIVMRQGRRVGGAI